MGLLQKIQAKTEEARAKEKIRPLLESRMMRDILLEIGQRGNEALDPQHRIFDPARHKVIQPQRQRHKTE